jgi:hypothetical protein
MNSKFPFRPFFLLQLHCRSSFEFYSFLLSFSIERTKPSGVEVKLFDIHATNSALSFSTLKLSPCSSPSILDSALCTLIFAN